MTPPFCSLPPNSSHRRFPYSQVTCETLDIACHSNLVLCSLSSGLRRCDRRGACRTAPLFILFQIPRPGCAEYDRLCRTALHFPVSRRRSAC